MEEENKIFDKLKAYKQKFFLSLLIKGVLISLASILGIFLLVNTLEYFLRFDSTVRASLFALLLLSSVALLVLYILIPAIKLYRSNVSMADYDAARNIGGFFPQISDKLLNVIQLSRNDQNDSSLLKAGIVQKSAGLRNVEFSKAVVLTTNRRYLPYFVVPLIILLALLVVSPHVITNSTTRIVRFNETFEPVAPFDFNLENSEMTAFKNDDFTVRLKLDGQAIPDEAYIKISGRSYKMISSVAGHFEYTLKKLQSDKNLTFQAAGFESRSFAIDVVERPLLKTFNVYLDFPKYLGRKKERLSNVGNLQVPEGTSVSWELSTANTRKIKMNFNNQALKPTSVESDIFQFNHRARASVLYNIELQN
ncbi:MAG: hypothetical protein AAGA02_03875, partial [Bacteroidota bacterium]